MLEPEITWRDLSACKDAPDELFFPENGYGYDEAASYCGDCPVQLICLTEALRYEAKGFVPFGFWGNTTPKQRKTMAKTRGLLEAGGAEAV